MENFKANNEAEKAKNLILSVTETKTQASGRKALEELNNDYQDLLKTNLLKGSKGFLLNEIKPRLDTFNSLAERGDFDEADIFGDILVGRNLLALGLNDKIVRTYSDFASYPPKFMDNVLFCLNKYPGQLKFPPEVRSITEAVKKLKQKLIDVNQAGFEKVDGLLGTDVLGYLERLDGDDERSFLVPN
ncbi:hypothetical protein KA036_02185 [Candidatus Gracilibacteria bacterium]|nr:hypothetical protein [Candidatus Gracilibacteria bacterium]